jgi:hypothetical protein
MPLTISLSGKILSKMRIVLGDEPLATEHIDYMLSDPPDSERKLGSSSEVDSSSWDNLESSGEIATVETEKSYLRLLNSISTLAQIVIARLVAAASSRMGATVAPLQMWEARSSMLYHCIAEGNRGRDDAPEPPEE